MDPLTHALSGALVGESFLPKAEQRVSRWAILAGSVIPDIDVLLNPFEPHDVGTIRWHRGVTHSLVCLPVFAVALAALARWICRRRGIPCPGWASLSGFFGFGIALHIFFDLITSFGTMVWSPLDWTRHAWDTTFIIDAFFTTCMLFPLLLAWIYSDREMEHRRAMLVWIAAAPFSTLVAWSVRSVGVPSLFSDALILTALLGALILAAGWRGWGYSVSRAAWCRGGLVATTLYLVLCFAAHQRALEAVRQFASSRRLQVESLAALPMPPSLLDWSGLVRTREGIYQAYFGVLKPREASYHFVPAGPSNHYVEAARQLPAVRAYLEFARFPFAVGKEERGEYIVEFKDMSFFPRRGNSPLFVYRVTLDAAGKALTVRWERACDLTQTCR